VFLQTRQSRLFQANLELLASNLFPKVRQLMEPFATASINYLLTEEQFNHNQINDPFFQTTFLPSLEEFLEPFKVEIAKLSTFETQIGSHYFNHL
jgi:hypothetical protein